MLKHKESSGFRMFSFLIALLLPLCLSAQQINLKGIVKDASGEGIPGASVVEKGTSNGTVAEADGSFTLKASQGAVLEISCVSYVTEEVKVDSRTYYEVVLRDDAELLSEVLVIGYGTIRKSDLTGAVSAISADKLKDSPVSNVGQALQGKVAGVQIIDSGTPGSNVNIKIRGLGSINNCDPLIVIDGVPTDLGLASLNTNDIERIDVLKDASAAAIYGSRGANGVVMITTKRGSEGKGRISVSANASFQNAHNVPQMLNAAQYAQLSNEMMAASGRNSNPEWTNPEALGAGTSWLDEMLNTGIVQNYTVSYSGGNDKAHYYVSGGFFDQSGIVKNVGYKKFTFQSNSDAQVFKWLKFTNNITFSADNKTSGEYNIGSIMSALPVFSVKDGNGDWSGLKAIQSGTAAHATLWESIRSTAAQLKDTTSLQTSALRFHSQNGSNSRAPSVTTQNSGSLTVSHRNSTGNQPQWSRVHATRATTNPSPICGTIISSSTTLSQRSIILPSWQVLLPSGTNSTI